MPTDPNLLALFARTLGLIVSLPVLYALWRAALFFARATALLGQIPLIASDVAALRHQRRDDAQEITLSLTIIENDINVLQKEIGVPVREFPDRRTGPADRRRA